MSDTLPLDLLQFFYCNLHILSRSQIIGMNTEMKDKAVEDFGTSVSNFTDDFRGVFYMIDCLINCILFIGPF